MVPPAFETHVGMGDTGIGFLALPRKDFHRSRNSRSVLMVLGRMFEYLAQLDRVPQHSMGRPGMKRVKFELSDTWPTGEGLRGATGRS
jgi:hypothetical protein